MALVLGSITSTPLPRPRCARFVGSSRRPARSLGNRARFVGSSHQQAKAMGSRTTPASSVGHVIAASSGGIAANSGEFSCTVLKLSIHLGKTWKRLYYLVVALIGQTNAACHQRLKRTNLDIPPMSDGLDWSVRGHPRMCPITGIALL
jgi:hypothetical protein